MWGKIIKSEDSSFFWTVRKQTVNSQILWPLLKIFGAIVVKVVYKDLLIANSENFYMIFFIKFIL